MLLHSLIAHPFQHIGHHFYLLPHPQHFKVILEADITQTLPFFCFVLLYSCVCISNSVSVDNKNQFVIQLSFYIKLCSPVYHVFSCSLTTKIQDLFISLTISFTSVSPQRIRIVKWQWSKERQMVTMESQRGKQGIEFKCKFTYSYIPLVCRQYFCVECSFLCHFSI